MAASSSSFDEMLDMPLNSSPLKALSRTPSPDPGLKVLSLPDSPTPQPARRKRPAEDMSQYAGEISRAHKLVKADHDELACFAKLGRSEQSISIMGHLLALGHQQRLLQPAEAAWVVPKRLYNKIEVKAALLIADASIPAYRAANIGPGKLLMDSVLANPGWGFTAEMREEKDAMDGLNSVISKVLTSKRNVVKTVILSSLGSPSTAGETGRTGALDIVELSKLILTKLKVAVKVDLRMCGRVSVLRKIVSEANLSDNKYWTAVDKKLAKVRTSHPNADKQSKWIKQYMLDPDLALYKHVELKNLIAIAGVPAVPVAGPSTLSADASDTVPDSDDDGSDAN
ncbi:hypothetical protein DFH08DRAFT_1079014 [Mycena albidolilacea]|uniref:Uncharacterized protein n=1 Tax=Mycena albidolilacea TaxID=1033008 RepID=A0AAD7A805_9AGAR|nr:hypothetical protein DFH08DRAFT_1079014 [Mycena albidolilacea]